jgi:uncharacterized protein
MTLGQGIRTLVFTPQQAKPTTKLVALVAVVNLLLVIGFSTKLIYDWRKIHHLKIATGAPGSEYYTFGEALKEVVEKHNDRIRIELVTDTQGSRENVRRLQGWEVDLALAQNDSPAEESVRSVALLFPEVVHLYVRDESPVQSVAHLNDIRMATLPAQSGTCYLMEELADHYDLTLVDDPNRFYRVDPKAAHELFLTRDVDAVFHIIALGQTAKDYVGRSLEQGARLLPIEQVQALQWTHPFLRPAVIPKGFYRGHPPLPQEDVPSAAVCAVLLANKQVNADLIYEISRILHAHRNELVKVNALASQMRIPDKPDQIYFPLHEGAEDYYNREKPGFLVTYAEPIALVLSVAVMCISGLWHVRLRLEQQRKDQADKYNLEILKLIETLPGITSMVEMAVTRGQLFDIFKTVIKDLADEKISADTFQLFTFPWEMAVCAIRHKEWILTTCSEEESPPNLTSSDTLLKNSEEEES